MVPTKYTKLKKKIIAWISLKVGSIQYMFHKKTSNDVFHKEFDSKNFSMLNYLCIAWNDFYKEVW